MGGEVDPLIGSPGKEGLWSGGGHKVVEGKISEHGGLGGLRTRGTMGGLG